METGIQADAKRSVRVIFRLDGFTLTPHPRLLFDVSYHVPRLGVSRQSCNKIPVQLRRFRLLTLSSPLPVDLRTPKLPVPVIASAPRLWFELAGRGLRCEASWVWLRRLLPALCRDLCRSASAYERDGGACFCTAASRITSLSSPSGSPVLPS